LIPRPHVWKSALAVASTVACTLIAAGAPTRAEPIGQTQLSAARAQLVAHYNDVVRRTGLDAAANLEERLDDDIGAFLSLDTPSNLSREAWIERLNALAALDTSFVNQVIAGKSEPILGSQGLVERLVLARTDRTLQPYALYVPNNLPPNPSLVVLLHGNPQTESEILVGPYFQNLADETKTVVAAPYGRGIYDYAAPADDEVYQVAQEVAAALHADPRKIFLAGYSMGGFSVFKIGPEHPAQWAAIMCISGSILNSETAAVSSAFAHTRIYVVNGAKDDNIPAKYGMQTAQWLAQTGIPTGFYQDPEGNHYLYTFMPALSRAWHEMIAGSIGLDAQPVAQPVHDLPEVAPPGATHP